MMTKFKKYLILSILTIFYIVLLLGTLYLTINVFNDMSEFNNTIQKTEILFILFLWIILFLVVGSAVYIYIDNKKNEYEDKINNYYDKYQEYNKYSE